MRQTPAYDIANNELLSLVPPNARRVVDVGCMTGAMARELRNRSPLTEVVGIDIDPSYAAAAARYCTKTFSCDIETIEPASWAELFPSDCWIFGDCLEHLRDPWRLLLNVRQAIDPDGCILVCLPNAQHWSVQWRLASGLFRYEDAGLMDRTHIRWFTRTTILEMFQATGWQVETGFSRNVPAVSMQDGILRALRGLAVAGGFDPELAVSDAQPFQYVFRCIPVRTTQDAPSETRRGQTLAETVADASLADVRAASPARHDAIMDVSRRTDVPVIAPHRRIISISMVKNEQDIIEPFIRHNARFVDCMIIVDNASVDETRRIAMDCARELGNVIIADSEEFSLLHAERMSPLLRSCTSAFLPDYVVFLDADEFLGAKDRGDLLTALERIAPGGVGLMAWQTFVVTPDQAPTNDPLQTMNRRRRAEKPAYNKVVLRLDGAWRADLLMTQGNHDVFTTSGERLPTILLDDLPLLHFPVRSREQLVVKGIVGWMTVLAREPRAHETGICFQWREAFERAVSGRTNAAELAEISMRYAQYPDIGIDWGSDIVEGTPPPNYERRYSTGAFGDPLVVVARSWERSLSPSPRLLQLHRPPGSLASAGITASAFDAAWHWDHLFVDVPPFRFIAEKNQPTAVLDIGCGVGAYLALFKRLGATSVVGVDDVPAIATVLAEGEYIVMDPSQPLDLGRMFDLVVCTEVVQHLSAPDADLVLENIVRQASHTIIFSAAEPGQGNDENINCRPISYWLERFANLGWDPDLSDTLGIRALATMSWFRRNLIVLRRGEPRAGTEAIRVLTAIGARSFSWYDQSPGIREFPFLEDLPPSPAGYLSEGGNPD